MTPDTMFKFVNVRPVQRADAPPRRFAIFEPGGTAFQTNLAELAGDDKQMKAIALAANYLQAGAYTKSDPPLNQPISLLEELASTTAKEPTSAAAKQKAAGVLGRPLHDWLTLADTISLKDAIWDAARAAPRCRVAGKSPVASALRRVLPVAA